MLYLRMHWRLSCNEGHCFPFWSVDASKKFHFPSLESKLIVPYRIVFEHNYVGIVCLDVQGWFCGKCPGRSYFIILRNFGSCRFTKCTGNSRGSSKRFPSGFLCDLSSFLARWEGEEDWKLNNKTSCMPNNPLCAILARTWPFRLSILDKIRYPPS